MPAGSLNFKLCALLNPMKDLKPLDIAHQFCRLLYYENTGTREELAKKLGISPSRVNIYRTKLEGLYKVRIYYSRKRQTYYVNNKEKLPPPPAI